MYSGDHSPKIAVSQEIEGAGGRQASRHRQNIFSFSSYWFGMSTLKVAESRTRSSWLNCALRDDKAVYWVSKGHYEAVAVGN